MDPMAAAVAVEIADRRFQQRFLLKAPLRFCLR